MTVEIFFNEDELMPRHWVCSVTTGMSFREAQEELKWDLVLLIGVFIHILIFFERKTCLNYYIFKSQLHYFFYFTFCL